MVLTWIFRALFVPLLVLAIVTSNCDAARAVDTDSGSRQAAVAALGESAPDEGTEFALIARIPLNDALAVDVRLGYLWGDESAFVAEASINEPGHDVCFDVGIELRPLQRAGLTVDERRDRIDCKDVGTASARAETPAGLL